MYAGVAHQKIEVLRIEGGLSAASPCTVSDGISVGAGVPVHQVWI